MRRILPLVVAAVLLAGVPIANAAELGSPAPALAIDQWVKGSPVTIAPGDKVYVVEFWATWCGPCLKSIPHLSELQKKFKDKNVVFIGISDETADEVKPFVQEQGEKMEYTVAIDKDRQTNEKYMKAFNQNGIPTAFVINKQAQIVWVGHPMDGLDEVVQEVVDGTFSLEKVKQREARKAEITEAVEKLSGAFDSKDKTQIQTAADDILKKYPDEADLLFRIARVLVMHDDVSIHNYPLALKLSKAAVDSSKGKDNVILDVYAHAQFKTGDVKGAIETQEKALASETSEDGKAYLQKGLDEFKAGAAPKAEAPK